MLSPNRVISSVARVGLDGFGSVPQSRPGGTLLSNQSYSAPVSSPAPFPRRKVGPLLGLGIALAPFLFAWALLRRGHSGFSRVVGFGWFALILTATVVQASHNQPGGGTSLGNPATNETAVQGKVARDADGAPPSVEGRKQFAALHHRFSVAVAPCDRARAGLVRARSRYALYNAAQGVRDACVSTMEEIDKLSIPSPISSAARSSIGTALKACAGSYSMWWSYANDVAKYTNGNMRPSEARDAQLSGMMAGVDMTKCMADYVDAVHKAGFEIPATQGHTTAVFGRGVAPLTSHRVG